MESGDKFKNILGDSRYFDVSAYIYDWKQYNKYSSINRSASDYLTVALSSPNIESDISAYLAGKYNFNSNVYDKAIDSVYNEAHTGGSLLHHNLDGAHTWHGAMESLRSAYPDDTEFQHVCHAFNHLARDLTTPSGINPFLNPEQFVSAKNALIDHFYFSKTMANDLLNMNAAELCGAAVAAMSLVFGFESIKIQKLGQYAARLSLSSFIAGNPALLIISIICIARICYFIWSGDSIIQVVDGIAQGIITASSVFYVASVFNPPFFIVLALGAVVFFGVNWAYNNLQACFVNDIDQIFRSQFPAYKPIVF